MLRPANLGLYRRAFDLTRRSVCTRGTKQPALSAQKAWFLLFISTQKRSHPAFVVGAAGDAPHEIGGCDGIDLARRGAVPERFQGLVDGAHGGHEGHQYLVQLL